MIEVIFTPKWFYGKDIIIDIVSIGILFLIAYFTFRFYLISKNKKYFFLTTSFSLIGMSFIFKIVTNFTLYFPIEVTKRLGFITYTVQALKATDTLFFIGYFLYRICTLIGLYLMVAIYKKQTRSSIFLVIYLLILSTFFSQNKYYVFHVTALIMLSIISYELYQLGSSKKIQTSRYLAYSFMIITFSNLLFIYIQINPLLYVIAEFIQLLGYSLLLITFFKVLNHGKEKKQIRHYS